MSPYISRGIFFNDSWVVLDKSSMCHNGDTICLIKVDYRDKRGIRDPPLQNIPRLACVVKIM